MPLEERCNSKGGSCQVKPASADLTLQPLGVYDRPPVCLSLGTGIAVAKAGEEERGGACLSFTIQENIAEKFGDMLKILSTWAAQCYQTAWISLTIQDVSTGRLGS